MTGYDLTDAEAGIVAALLRSALNSPAASRTTALAPRPTRAVSMGTVPDPTERDRMTPKKAAATAVPEPEWDKLTADELREGDVLLKDGKVDYTVLSVSKNPATGDVFAKVKFEVDGGIDARTWNEADAVPHRRGSQYQGWLDAQAEAERAAAEADEADGE